MDNNSSESKTMRNIKTVATIFLFPLLIATAYVKIYGLQNELEKTQSELEKTQSELSQTKGDLAKTQNIVKQQNFIIANLVDSLSTSKQELTKIRQKLNASNGLNSELTKELQDKLKKIDDMTERIKLVEKQNEETGIKLRETQKKYGLLQSQYDELSGQYAELTKDHSKLRTDFNKEQNDRITAEESYSKEIEGISVRDLTLYTFKDGFDHDKVANLKSTNTAKQIKQIKASFEISRPLRQNESITVEFLNSNEIRYTKTIYKKDVNSWNKANITFNIEPKPRKKLEKGKFTCNVKFGKKQAIIESKTIKLY